MPLGGLVGEVAAALEAAQAALPAEATDRRDRHTMRVFSIDAAVAAAATGFAPIPWAAVGLEGEARLAESAVTVRCLQRPDGSLALSYDEPDLVAGVGRAY